MTESATLIAAVIAAAASLAGLAFNIRAQSRSEICKANRSLLGPHLNGIARALHEVLASSTILTKARTDESRANWRARAVNAQSTIKEIRSELRYPLWGIHEGLRVLSRLPNWLEHTQDSSSGANDIWAAGNKLRGALDLAIRDAYRFGRPPSWWHCYRVRRRAREVRALYRKCRQEQDPELREMETDGAA